VGHFPKHLQGEKFKSNSRCLLKVFNVLVAQLYNITIQEALELNYDKLMDLGIEMASQVEWAAQVTHGEITFPEHLTKIFSKRECVMCQCSLLLEIHIILNTRFFQLHHQPDTQHVQVRMLVNRTIKEIQSEQLFAVHPSPFYNL
jgi:hypothetical protein